ncbi:MAG: hypothetical protein DHS20C11_11580 [Lysobacteraceae bacterium]|nr:MAG: hypothetical protein DHS20C11_11580 [Xanthomonadaceae bacterium]
MADLSITKEGSVETVVVWFDMSYTITVANAGPETAENVVVSDTLPADVFVNGGTTGCLNDPGGMPNCLLEDIAPGDSVQYSFDISVELGASGVLTNTATVESDTADPDDSNNTAIEMTNVQPLADLVPSINGPTSIQSPDTITITVEVFNAGPSDAPNVIIDAAIDSAGEVVRTEGCLNATSSFPVCQLGDMPVGTTSSYDLTIRVSPSSPTFSLTTTASSDAFEYQPSNNTVVLEAINQVRAIPALQPPALLVLVLLFGATAVVLLGRR